MTQKRHKPDHLIRIHDRRARSLQRESGKAHLQEEIVHGVVAEGIHDAEHDEGDAGHGGCEGRVLVMFVSSLSKSGSMSVEFVFEQLSLVLLLSLLLLSLSSSLSLWKSIMVSLLSSVE